MFGNLFEKKAAAAESKEDRVWKTATACRNGICAEAIQSATAGRTAIVVCLVNSAFDAVDTVLATHHPIHCRDLFGRDALRGALAGTGGGTIVIALSGSLPADAIAATGAVDVLVYGRNTTRTADAAITRFADQLRPCAAIAFHLSLEDALLKPLTASGVPLLERLGLKDDEAMSHPVLTRAIKNIQPT